MSDYFWSPIEDKLLLEYVQKDLEWLEIGKLLNRSGEGARKRYQVIRGQVPDSSYPVWEAPLEMKGDALILPDVEAPFHHADFMNRCLDLADAWGITQSILAGDAVHLDSLSSWGPKWKSAAPGIDENSRQLLEQFVDSLQGEKRLEGWELLSGLAANDLDTVSTELREARKVFQVLDQRFETVHYVLGNHCSRWLRAFEQDVLPQELLINLQVDNPKWKISSNFYSILQSGGETWRIEHPVGSGKETAVNLADTFECHVTMAHSHRWKMEFSTSGKWWAIHMGHIVDENRLAYVMQRSKGGRNPHKLGALIIRDGYPHLLNEHTPWKQYERM